MTKRERAYMRKMEGLIRKAGKLQDAEVRRVLEILEHARLEVAARIAETEWQAYHIPQLKSAVKTTIEGFERRYGVRQSEALRDAHLAAADVVDAPLNYVGLRVPVVQIPATHLDVLQGYSADLIEGLTKDLLKKVNGEITLGIIGQRTPHQVMEALGLSLDDKGVFKSIAARAEAITRTEMGRVYAASREARHQQVVALGEMTWRKRWISSGKARPRPNHAALNGVEVPVDADFSGGHPLSPCAGAPGKGDGQLRLNPCPRLPGLGG